MCDPVQGKEEGKNNPDTVVAAAATEEMTAVIPKFSKLSKRVIRVLGCNPGYFTLQGTNTYILGTGKNRLLIDTGEPDIPEYIQNLKNVVRENNISLTKILLTHWHMDHVGGVHAVLEHIAEKDCQVYKYPSSEHDAAIENGNFQLTYLNDQDELEVEGASVKIYFTPGHAKDHVCLYLKEEDNLFSADCVLGEGSAVFEDLLVYLESLRKIASLRPNKLYPGHGPVVEHPQDKVKEYIEKRMERENQILEVLEQQQKNQDSGADGGGWIMARAIVKAIYPTLPPKLMFGAEWNVRNHLDKLVQENRVEKIEQEDLIPKYRLKTATQAH